MTKNVQKKVSFKVFTMANDQIVQSKKGHKKSLVGLFPISDPFTLNY